MPNILIRDVPEETKRLLEERAKANGRSQNAEAVAILQKELQPAKKTVADYLLAMAASPDGIDLVLPKRQPARQPDVWWLKEGAQEEWAELGWAEL